MVPLQMPHNFNRDIGKESSCMRINSFTEKSFPHTDSSFTSKTSQSILVAWPVLGGSLAVFVVSRIGSSKVVVRRL